MYYYHPYVRDDKTEAQGGYPAQDHNESRRWRLRPTTDSKSHVPFSLLPCCLPLKCPPQPHNPQVPSEETSSNTGFLLHTWISLGQAGISCPFPTSPSRNVHLLYPCLSKTTRKTSPHGADTSTKTGKGILRV